MDRHVFAFDLVAERTGICPVVSTDEGAICAEECSDDSDCAHPTKCCSNGCGHVCMVPDLGENIITQHA